MFDTDGNAERHPGWNHFDRVDEGTLACRHCGICITEFDLDVLLAHLEDRHGDEDFETFHDAVEDPAGDTESQDAFIDDLQHDFEETGEGFEESKDSSLNLSTFRPQVSHSSSSSPSTSSKAIPNRKRLPDSTNEPTTDYLKSKLGRFLNQVDSIRHSKVADDGSEEQMLMLESMRKRIYPKWNLVAKFTSKAEFDNAVKARFAVAVEKRRIKRCRRYSYVCQVARYCSCEYRMMTLSNDLVFYLYDYGKHNHPEMDRKTAIEAESKTRLEAVMKSIGYEPPAVTESDETVNNQTSVPNASLENPQLPPGTATGTFDAEFQSKLFAKYENDLDSCWTLVSRPTSKAELFKAVRKAGLTCRATSTVYHIVRRRYYCKNQAPFECPYRMYCIYSDTQCVLYETGRHNHDESDQLKPIKNLECQTKLFAKLEGNLDSCWALVSRPTSKAELFKTVKEYGVHATSCSTIDHIRHRRFCCKKRAEFDCPYRMYCFSSDTQFVIYESGRHNHDESGRLIYAQASVESTDVGGTVTVDANVYPETVDTDKFDKEAALPCSSGSVSYRQTLQSQQSSNDDPNGAHNNSLTVTLETSEDPAINNVDERDAMPSSSGFVSSRQTPQPLENPRSLKFPYTELCGHTECVC